jgi:Outer membrane protein beta-barrel domain
MKKLIVAALLCIPACLYLSAQVHTSIKAGPEFSMLKYRTGTNQTARIGYYGGVAVTIDLKNQFFLKPELLYSLRGYAFPAVGSSSKGRVGYGYVSVPLLAGYTISKKVALLVGPEVGYMMSAKSHLNNSTYNILSQIGQKYNIDADAGMQWAVTKTLTLEARLLVGLTPLYKAVMTDQNGAETGVLKDGYNRVLQIGVAYTLN